MRSVRFAPPLVISEEELDQALEVIKQALVDLDEVKFPCLLVARPTADSHLSAR